MLDVQTQSVQDLADDFARLHAFAVGAREQLREFQDFLQRSHGSVLASSAQRVLRMLQEPLRMYDSLIEECEQVLDRRDARQSEEHLLAISQEKKRITDAMRTLQSIAAGYIASVDWQSPSYVSSIASQAGRFTGMIDGQLNDYQRDHHHDAENYERLFCREYIDASLHVPPRVFLTSSGMAAFTTIVTMLRATLEPMDRILVGRGSYFEINTCCASFLISASTMWMK
jgi:hypothetical protein